MRVLLLTFYYEPDLSAGSFRAAALVKALRQLETPGLTVDVVTTEPNRYHSFNTTAAGTGHSPEVEVQRIRLPQHRSDMLGQARAFATYARAAMRLTAGKRYDVVVATSSRLMTAALGAFVARRAGAPLYLDIRDIFVDTMADVLPGAAGRLLQPVLNAIERRTMRQAARINLVSEGFAGYFTARYPDRPLSFHTNGIDDEFLQVPDQQAPPGGAVAGDGSIAEVLYAGNIGEGQGLHLILPQLARQLRGSARFTVIGDGGRKRELEAGIRDAGVEDLVSILPPVARKELLERYRRADVLFLHLNAYDAFLKVLPSKIFEYGALGKPILAGVAGFAGEFVSKEVDNAAVFPPCDPAAGAAAFRTLSLETVQRARFRQKFARARIKQAMARDILQTAPPESAQ